MVVAIVTTHRLIPMASLTSSTASRRWNCSLATTFQFSLPQPRAVLLVLPLAPGAPA